MRLTVVGCSGSMSGRRSAASCYLLQAEDSEGNTRSLVIDLGPGGMGGMLNYVDPRSLDAILLTHLHADHMVDMIGMHVYRRWHPAGQLAPVDVYAPAGVMERVRGVGGDTEEETYETQFTFKHVSEGMRWRVGPFEIEAYPMLHPVEAYGYRITGPAETGEVAAMGGLEGEGAPVLKAPGLVRRQPTGDHVTFGYTGDTDWCQGAQELSRGLDLLLCEAAFQEGRDTARGIHLTGKRAGKLAAQAGVKRLILTHLQPWNDPAVSLAEASAHYEGPIELASPGSVYSF